MSEIQMFEFPATGQAVRIMDMDGNPWFIRNDACNMLGHKNPSQATSDHCKPEGIRNTEILTKGGMQTVVIINEANFNRLVMRSNVKHALEVQDWVCEVVIPSIRKTGSYNAKPHPSPEQFLRPSFEPNPYVMEAIPDLDKRAEYALHMMGLELVTKVNPGVDPVNLNSQIYRTHAIAANRKDVLELYAPKMAVVVDEHSKDYTATALGHMLARQLGGKYSAQAVNQMLAGLGIITKDDLDNWQITPFGSTYAVKKNQPGLHSGKPVVTQYYDSRVIGLLKNQLESE